MKHSTTNDDTPTPTNTYLPSSASEFDKEGPEKRNNAEQTRPVNSALLANSTITHSSMPVQYEREHVKELGDVHKQLHCADGTREVVEIWGLATKALVLHSVVHVSGMSVQCPPNTYRYGGTSIQLHVCNHNALTFTLSHSHIHTYATLTVTHTHTIALQSRTHNHSLTLTHTQSLTVTHTHSLTLSHTHTHTHT